MAFDTRLTTIQGVISLTQDIEILKDQVVQAEAAAIADSLSSYIDRPGCWGCLHKVYLCVLNAFRSLFGCSDWQNAEKLLKDRAIVVLMTQMQHGSTMGGKHYDGVTFGDGNTPEGPSASQFEESARSDSNLKKYVALALEYWVIQANQAIAGKNLSTEVTSKAKELQTTGSGIEQLKLKYIKVLNPGAPGM